MFFRKELGMSPQSPEEQDSKKYKEQGQRHSILKQPAVLQSLLIFGVVAALLLSNYDKIASGLSSYITGISGLQLRDLFVTSFIFNLIFFAYIFLMNYCSANVVNKMVYTKLFRKRMVICRGDDRIFRLLIVDDTRKTYKIEGIGEWKINKGAMGWLENGILMALCKEGFAELIDLDDIEAKNGLIIDNKVFEDRVLNAQIKAEAENTSLLNAKTITYLVPIIFALGIAGYLVMTNLQQGSCQAELVDLAKTCGQVAKAQVENVTRTVVTLPKPPIISGMT